MNEKMMELLKKKMKDGKMHDKDSKHGKVKSEMLDAIMKMMDEVSGQKLKKVTVAAPTTEGLKAGLEKAEEVIEGSEEMEDEDMEDDMEEKKSDIEKLRELAKKK